MSSLKYLQFVESSAAGVGRHVMDLTTGLLDRGHQVHLVYSDSRSDRVFCQDLCRLADYPGFRARRIQMRRELHALDLLAARSLRRYLCSHGPFDLVHCHSSKAGVVGRLGLVGNSAKVLYTPHMFYSMEPTRSATARQLVCLLEASLSNISDSVIVLSREERQHAIELGIPPSKLCLIPNGIALDDSPARGRTEIRRQWGLRDRELCIGFVGRLVPQKSPETMLRALAILLRDAAAPVRLVMVGDGPLAGACHRLASGLAIEPHILWLGEQDAKELMHAFDMLALTSDSEGHPLVILEAMARGLPIVATRVGGVADTVRSGVNGFVVPVRDADAIAQSLRALIDDPILRGNMGVASRVLSRDFSVDRMVDRTLNLYEQVVAGAWDGRAASELTAAASR